LRDGEFLRRVASLFFSFFNILARIWAWRSAEGGSYNYTTACCWFGLVLRPFLKSFTHLLPSGWRHVRRVGRRVETSLCLLLGHASAPGSESGWVFFTYIYIYIYIGLGSVTIKFLNSMIIWYSCEHLLSRLLRLDFWEFPYHSSRSSPSMFHSWFRKSLSRSSRLGSGTTCFSTLSLWSVVFRLPGASESASTSS
jgi:hypothetical protein